MATNTVPKAYAWRAIPHQGRIVRPQEELIGVHPQRLAAMLRTGVAGRTPRPPAATAAGSGTDVDGEGRPTPPPAMPVDPATCGEAADRDTTPSKRPAKRGRKASQPPAPSP